MVANVINRRPDLFSAAVASRGTIGMVFEALIIILLFLKNSPLGLKPGFFTPGFSDDL